MAQETQPGDYFAAMSAYAASGAGTGGGGAGTGGGTYATYEVGQPAPNASASTSGDSSIGEEILRQYLTTEAMHDQMYSSRTGADAWQGSDNREAGKKQKGADVSQLQVEYFSLVPSANGECVKLLSENMLQSSAVAAATAIQGLGAHASTSDEPPAKAKQAPRSRTWTKEADAAIIDLVAEYGPKHWSQIAARVPGRTGKQCRERWQHHLNPHIKKETWSQEEDMILIAAHRTYGNRWAQIAKLLPGRTDNGIKNRWNTTLRRRLRPDGFLKRAKQEGMPVQQMSGTVMGGNPEHMQNAAVLGMGLPLGSAPR